jgi:hypothetical protein
LKQIFNMGKNAALLVALAAIVDDLKTWVEGGDSVMGLMVGDFQTWLKDLRTVWEWIKTDPMSFFVEAIKTFGQMFKEAVDFWHDMIVGDVKKQTERETTTPVRDARDATALPNRGVLSGGSPGTIDRLNARYQEMIGKAITFSNWVASGAAKRLQQTMPAATYKEYAGAGMEASRLGLQIAAQQAGAPQAVTNQSNVEMQANVNVTVQNDPTGVGRQIGEELGTAAGQAVDNQINRTPGG